MVDGIVVVIGDMPNVDVYSRDDPDDAVGEATLQDRLGRDLSVTGAVCFVAVSPLLVSDKPSILWLADDEDDWGEPGITLPATGVVGDVDDIVAAYKRMIIYHTAVLLREQIYDVIVIQLDNYSEF